MEILVNHGDGAYGILLPDMGDLIAPYYDSTATYSLGDYVLYQGKLYKCTTAVSTAEEFDPTKWTQTTVTNAINDAIDEAVTDVLDTSY